MCPDQLPNCLLIFSLMKNQTSRLVITGVRQETKLVDHVAKLTHFNAGLSITRTFKETANQIKDTRICIYCQDLLQRIIVKWPS